MVTWICDNCGAEFEMEEGVLPVECPECGCENPRIKPPAEPDQIKIKPGG